MLKKSLVVLMAVIGIAGLVLISQGCKAKDETTTPSESDVKEALGATVDLCIDCGQIKGAETCCAADAEKCPACTLAKGSPGCCNIPEGADKAALCTKCGQIAGADACCAADAAKCDECGLAKGSPGCCKLPAK